MGDPKSRPVQNKEVETRVRATRVRACDRRVYSDVANTIGRSSIRLELLGISY